MLNKLKALQEKLGISQSKFICLAISLLLLIPLFLLDILTKVGMERLLSEKGTITVIDNFFYLELSYNKGCFNGWGADSIPAHILLIIISFLGALVILWVLLFKVKILSNIQIIGLGLMLPGDLGNLVDRVIFSKENGFRGVIDFLRCDFGSYTWPNFNVADSLLVVGIILFAIGIIFESSSKELDKAIEEEDNKNSVKKEFPLLNNEGKDSDE